MSQVHKVIANTRRFNGLVQNKPDALLKQWQKDSTNSQQLHYLKRVHKNGENGKSRRLEIGRGSVYYDGHERRWYYSYSLKAVRESFEKAQKAVSRALRNEIKFVKDTMLSHFEIIVQPLVTKKNTITYLFNFKMTVSDEGNVKFVYEGSLDTLSSKISRLEGDLTREIQNGKIKTTLKEGHVYLSSVQQVAGSNGLFDVQQKAPVVSGVEIKNDLCKQEYTPQQSVLGEAKERYVFNYNKSLTLYLLYRKGFSDYDIYQKFQHDILFEKIKGAIMEFSKNELVSIVSTLADNPTFSKCSYWYSVTLFTYDELNNDGSFSRKIYRTEYAATCICQAFNQIFENLGFGVFVKMGMIFLNVASGICSAKDYLGTERFQMGNSKDLLERNRDEIRSSDYQDLGFEGKPSFVQDREEVLYWRSGKWKKM